MRHSCLGVTLFSLFSTSHNLSITHNSDSEGALFTHIRYITFSRRTRLLYSKCVSQQCTGLDDKRPGFFRLNPCTVPEKVSVFIIFYLFLMNGQVRGCKSKGENINIQENHAWLINVISQLSLCRGLCVAIQWDANKWPGILEFSWSSGVSFLCFVDFNVQFLKTNGTLDYENKQNIQMELKKKNAIFKKNLSLAGLEPATFRVWGGRDNHYTTKTNWNSVGEIILFIVILIF